MLVDTEKQTIEVDGQPLKTQVKRYYIALHKPIGYVSTVADRFAEKKVTDLVQIAGARLVPAGRLDADSEGLILLSNDGDFVYKVTHPSQSLGKTYRVTVQGNPDAEKMARLSRGLMLPGEKRSTAAAGAKWLGRGPNKTSIVEIVMHEGRNRQVRRMMEVVGHPVVRLIRIRVGPVWLGDLQAGQWRELSGREVEEILAVEGAAPEASRPAAENRVVKSVRPKNSTTKIVVQRRGNGEERREDEHRRPPRPEERRFAAEERPRERRPDNRAESGHRSEERPRGNFRPEERNGNGNRPEERPRISRPGPNGPRGNESEGRPGSGNRPPQGERPSYGARPSYDRPGVTGRGEHSFSRPRDNDRNDRPSYNRPGNGRPERPSYDRPENGRPARPSYERPGNGRPERPSYDRPRDTGRNERPAFDRPRDNGRDERPRPGGGGQYRDNRGNSSERRYDRPAGEDSRSGRDGGRDRRPPAPGRRPDGNAPRPGGFARKEGDRPMANQRPIDGRNSRPNFRPKEKGTNETGSSGSARPGPGQNNGKPASGRFQVHQDRFDGRVPPRGERDTPDRGGRPGRGAMPRDNRRGQQNT